MCESNKLNLTMRTTMARGTTRFSSTRPLQATLAPPGQQTLSILFRWPPYIVYPWRVGTIVCVVSAPDGRPATPKTDTLIKQLPSVSVLCVAWHVCGGGRGDVGGPWSHSTHAHASIVSGPPGWLAFATPTHYCHFSQRRTR